MGTKSGMLYKRGESRFWWIKYNRNGGPVRESTGTDKETEARRILRERLGDIAAGRPVVPRADRVRFEELAEDFLNDYRMNGKRSLDWTEGSVEHLKGYLADWKAINITTPAGTVTGTEKENAATSAAQVLEEMVGRGRIELPTPGFSVSPRPIMPESDSEGPNAPDAGETRASRDSE